MGDLKDDITIRKVENLAKIDNSEVEGLFVKLKMAEGFREGDAVIILKYDDFPAMTDVNTVSELKRKLESYVNSFKRVGELRAKLESMEIFYREQLRDLKAQYTHQISKLTPKSSWKEYSASNDKLLV